MSRTAAFRFTIVPDDRAERALARHVGARRFAYNQCLVLVREALDARKAGSSPQVPWSGFSLINAFNGWKRSGAAGRTFAVSRDGIVQLLETGLRWRREVWAGVFEEAAVDLGRALQAYSDSRAGKRPGPRVGFPQFKTRDSAKQSFRVRNRLPPGGRQTVRVGDRQPRSLTLPAIGDLRVREDTRALRRTFLYFARFLVVEIKISPFSYA